MEPKELLAQGIEAARKGDHDRAKVLIAKAVKADPSLQSGWWALANLLENIDQQRHCLQQVLKLDPSNEQARTKLEQLSGVESSSASQSRAPSASEGDSSFHLKRAEPPPQHGAQDLELMQRVGKPMGSEPPRRRRPYLIAGASIVGVIVVGVLLILLVRVLLPALSADEQDELANQPVPSHLQTWTPTPEIMILVPTHSLTPSATQPEPLASPTRTSTPGPSLTPTLRYTLTITPTFNPRAVPTKTRAAPATCPVAASPGPLQLTELFEDFYAPADEVLAYLNAGGSLAEVRRALGEQQAKTKLIVVDLTHDGVDEIVLFTLPVYVFSCHEGVYVKLLEVQPDISDPYFAGVDLISQDLNSDGVADLLIESSYMGARNSTLNVQVYEWNGEAFVSLIPEAVHHPYQALGHIMFDSDVQVSMFNGHLRLEDIDRNGTVEIILRGGVEYGYVAQLSAPQPIEIHTWMWNGDEFNFFDVAFSPPTLKIHAVQAGDVASQLSNYEEALELYWQTIEDPSLEAWNVERNEWMPAWTDPGTPTPTHPPPDPDQGDRVEAYARFRIILTNYLLGRVDEAEEQYRLIQSIHPPGDPGHPYAQLASTFIDTYQDTSLIGKACAAARNFADQNAMDITVPLGWAVYGEANMSYGAEDICPFQ